MPLAAAIRAEALRLGFAAAGFAAAGPARSFPRFRDWLDRGCAAGMAYLERRANLRQDVRRLAPWARSVIAVAAPYPAARPLQPFSTYALGRDYHAAVHGRLRRLARAVEALASRPVQARICVDSAPILEREWAVRAGLGWIGRQGSLVNARWGCTLFLGELLVNLDLPEDGPAASQCGDCRRCLDACPAGALQPDGLVDARRCLSYLTVEHRGEWPPGAPAPRTGALFGCDACTAVCPFNPRQAADAWPEFLPGPDSAPTAAECLAMEPGEFKRRFRDTAVFRSGLDRLRRNAQAVLQAGAPPAPGETAGAPYRGSAGGRPPA